MRTGNPIKVSSKRTVYRVCTGIKNVNIGIMEHKMETTIMGYVRVILGL